MNLYQKLSDIGLCHHYECDASCVGRINELDMCLEILEWVREYVVEKGLKG